MLFFAIRFVDKQLYYLRSEKMVVTKKYIGDETTAITTARCIDVSVREREKSAEIILSVAQTEEEVKSGARANEKVAYCEENCFFYFFLKCSYSPAFSRFHIL